MEEPDAPVFVIDLRPSTAVRARTVLDGHADELVEPIAHVAITDHDGDIDVHAIEPTTDLRLLDALARLIRFADARGLSVMVAAERYGTEYERRLLFERRLPAWALGWGGTRDRS
ncbi:MAG: hypothetical protein AB8I08_14135 [Sandaracinaceae bacterium]